MLRHENSVLRCQLKGPVRYEWADRLWLSTLSSLIPRRRWADIFPVTPGTLLAWHRKLIAKKWRDRPVPGRRPPQLAALAGHALIDRALYLTKDWAGDDERRELTGVPDELAFETRPQLASTMLARARASGFAARWVAADEVYGGRELRQNTRELGYGYAIAVPAPHLVDTAAGPLAVVDVLARLPRRAWQRLRTGHGTKGDRHYDWAMIDITGDDTPPGHGEGHSVLLVRRHRYTRELSFYRCHSTTPIALAELVAVICTRWRIEEDFAAAKSLTGLDQGQVTCWNSWMRWSLISLVAAALLAVAHARTRPTGPKSEPGLIPLTRSELLALPTPLRSLEHVLHWSRWRRRHQHRAATCHRRWNETIAAATT